MNKKLDALLDNLDDVKNPKEKVSVLHIEDFAPGGHLVAFVNVEKDLSIEKKLEKAYMLTNSITDAWWNKKEVTKMFPDKACRSTSLNDIVLIGTKKYKVDDCGWSEV